MRDVAARLLGREAGRLLDLLVPEDDRGRGDGPGTRVAEAGQWCQTPPGHGAISRLALRQVSSARERGRWAVDLGRR